MTPAERQALRELEAKAEQPPWEVSQPYPEMAPIVRVPGQREVCVTAEPRYFVTARADANLIAAARNALPELLNDIDRLEEALRDLNAAGLACAANLVRLPWVDEAPQDSVDRDSVVDIALRLKTGCDVARAVLSAAPEEKVGVK